MSEPRSSEDQPDHEWLEARERGEDIGHVPAHKREPYEKLGKMLASGMAPSPGFRKRVLDAIDAEEAKATEAAATDGAPKAAGIARVEAAAVAGAETGKEDRESARKAAATAVPMEAVWTVGREQMAESLRDRVDVELAEKRAQLRRQRLRRLAMASGLVAAAAAVAFWLRQDPAAPRDEPKILLASSQKIAVKAEVLRNGGRTVRGDHDSKATEATVGNKLAVNAQSMGPAELRVYGGYSGERLITRCNESERGDCKIDRKGEVRSFSLVVPLDELGTVQAVVFLGAGIPPSTRQRNSDLEAAATAGITYELSSTTNVR
jgi:hypothetical protein